MRLKDLTVMIYIAEKARWACHKRNDEAFKDIKGAGGFYDLAFEILGDREGYEDLVEEMMQVLINRFEVKGKAVDLDVLIREMVEIRMKLLYRINEELKAKGKELTVETEISVADVEYKSLYVEEEDGDCYFSDELDSYVVELYEKNEKDTVKLDELSHEDMFEVALNVDLKYMLIEEWK